MSNTPTNKLNLGILRNTLRQRRLQAIIFLLAALVGGCITVLDVETEQNERILVVEGFITTRPAAHEIKLTKTAKYGSVFDGVIRNEIGADIWIRDDVGRVTFLTEQGAGLYVTPSDFAAEVGRSYSINIKTTDQNTYASVPETVIPVPALDSLFFVYKKLPSSDPLNFRSGVEVYGAWQDPPDADNFYIWRNRGTYFIKTFPENFVATGPFGRVNAPKDCCAECWVSELNGGSGVQIFKDDNSNGLVATNQVAFIEDDGGRFMDQYEVVIDQQSISKDAFLFFELLANQMSIDGDIFDPPPATIAGNIINLEDPESPVIGYFYAADVSTQSIFVPRDVLEETQSLRVFNDDCRVLRGATVLKPDNWE